DGVVDHGVGAGDVQLELDHSCTASWNRCRLHVAVDHGACFEPDPVEHFADDVEAAGEVRAPVAYEEAHGLADADLEGVVADHRAGTAVEDHVGGVFVDGAHHVELLQAAFTEVALGVEVSLDDVELVVDRLETVLGFHHDQAVHAVGDVHADWRSGAVVDVHARVERREGEGGLLPRGDECGFGSAALAGYRVQVDVVRHHAVGTVLEREGDVVAFTDPDHRTWDAAAEGPEAVLNAVGELEDLLGRLEFEGHVRAVVAVDGRCCLRCVAHHALDDGEVFYRDLVLWIAAQCAFRPDTGDGEVVNMRVRRADGSRVLQRWVRGDACHLVARPAADGEGNGQCNRSEEHT